MNGSLSNTSLGRFQVLDLIGRGGMGEVYRARDTALGRDLAIKVLPPELTRDGLRVERFIKEARAASALNHPHLVSIYEIGTEPVHYMAMELVHGQTLRAILKSGVPDRKAAIDWLLQICDAVAAAHAAGVVHRDIKPENLIVANNGYAKVLDFGIAKLKADEVATADDATRGVLTDAGVVVGTTGYTSPEQARGLPVDHRSDIFSFGCVIYECLTGLRAFDGASAVERLHRVIHDEPAPLATRAADVSPELAGVVRKCLAKDPAERYQSMTDLGIDLRYVRRQLETSSSAPVATVGRAPRVLWPAIAAVAAALAIAVFLYGRGSDNEQTPVVADPVAIERLTATGDTIDAVISPDGKHLAHIEAIGQAQALWVLDIESGQDTKIFDLPDFSSFGIRFSPDGGSIYLTGRGKGLSNGRLFVVARSGGTPRAVLSGIVTPVTFSPDGRQIAFLREQYPDQDSSALMIADADGGGERVVSTRRNPELFVPAFFTGPSWSADGAVIVASTRNRAAERARLIAFDARSGAARELYESDSDITFTQWLPDGTGVLFVSRPFVNFAGTGGQVWVLPYPQGNVRRLTNDVLDYRKVTIAADGETLLAIGQEMESKTYLVPLDGTPPERIPTERYDGLQGIAQLPDRSLIVTTVIGGQLQLMRVSADGRSRTLLTRDGTNIFPAVSRDGSRVAMVSTRDGQVGVWGMNVDGSEQRLLAHIPAASWLSFTPDGVHVICSSLANTVPSTWRVPFDGGQAVEIARHFSRAVVSPDGKWLGGQYMPAGNTENTTSFAAIVPTDGGAPPRLLAPLQLATGSGVVAWAPDSSGMILSTRERFNLWFFSANGDAPKQLTNLRDEEFIRGALTADGRSVVGVRGTFHRDVYRIRGFK
jgi:eukaryotic-like serine/threonine-protein kinase